MCVECGNTEPIGDACKGGERLERRERERTRERATTQRIYLRYPSEGGGDEI
jgi:hypothetical protein